MFIQLQNHKAHVFAKADIDKNKKTIFFIPGAGMDHRVISMMHLDSISKEYNILGIDLPGHGYTTGPILKDVESHSLFCIELIKKLQIEQIIFIGHSWGGLIALHLSTRHNNEMTICMNTGYPFVVGDMLLDYAKGNLDQAVEFLTKYGVYKLPEVDIKSKGFGVKGSGFYGRSKGQIKSPYGTKVVEADPDREIKLYPLKRLFNQTQKEISSIDLRSCTNFRMGDKDIEKLSNVKYIFSEKDKLARYSENNPLLKGLKIDKDIHILKETGHFPYFENPSQLQIVLKQILSNN